MSNVSGLTPDALNAVFMAWLNQEPLAEANTKGFMSSPEHVAT